MAQSRTSRRTKIRKSIRAKISGTAEMPRLCVFRSNKDIYAQVIDDAKGITICAASSKVAGVADSKITKVEKSAAVGKKIAELAIQAGVKKVAFDRGGYLYHGRVKSLAEGAREGGLEF